MANLTFSDDFNSLNSWNAQYNTNGVWRQDYGYGGINDYKLGSELQLYTGPYFNGHSGDFNDGNYQLSNGMLSLVAHQTTNSEVLGMGYNYTSGMITTRGLEPWLGGPTSQFSQEYGYFEMRADLSDEPGAWNAFWLLPAGGTSSGWNYAETDIVESVGRDNGKVWNAVHGAADQGQYAPGVNVAGDGFHTFALDWTPDTMTWYVDGAATYSIATPSDMHQPMIMIANLAVGGSWAGAPDFGADGQAAMKIDYIKVWDSNPYVSGGTASSSVAMPDSPETLTAPDSGGVLAGGSAGDFIQGGVSGDYLTGNDGQDTIFGGDGGDSLNGNVGNDFVHGDGGNDVVLGGKDDDTIYGDLGNDTMNGNLGNDMVDGGDGNDVVRGGQGDDALYGGAGDDFISGDRGNDTETGGGGADTFYSFGDAGTDVVTDFHASEGDRVVIASGTSFTVSQSGADIHVDMSGGAELILQNVDLSTLPAGWIVSG